MIKSIGFFFNRELFFHQKRDFFLMPMRGSRSGGGGSRYSGNSSHFGKQMGRSFSTARYHGSTGRWQGYRHWKPQSYTNMYRRGNFHHYTPRHYVNYTPYYSYNYSNPWWDYYRYNTYNPYPTTTVIAYENRSDITDNNPVMVSSVPFDSSFKNGTIHTTSDTGVPVYLYCKTGKPFITEKNVGISVDGKNYTCP